ncbi:T9SS-dependent choice-of-anchor J family protein [Flavobacterium hydrocarbonoxydans]|nr:choice-of-anchor J domain-containing protein [Flavobacterium hydrocarbonoxydans]
MQKTTLVILFSLFSLFFSQANPKPTFKSFDINFDVTVSLIGEVMVEYHDYNPLVTYDWQFEYGPVGFLPGTGTSQTISGIDFYRFNIDPLKKYEFRVRERHLDGVNLVWGAWSQTKTVFATSDKVYSVGYTTDFNNQKESELEWRGYVYNNRYAFVGISTGENHSDSDEKGSSGEMSNTNYDDNGHVAFISPKFNDLATDRKIKFWLTNFYTDEELLVGTMSDPSDLNTFHLLSEVTYKSGADWNLETVYFNNYNGTDEYVVFLYKPKYSGVNSYINIDDFSYETASNCFNLTDFKISDIKENSAQISFVGLNQDNFQVSLTNVTKRTTQVFNTTSSPFDLTNLSGNTDYEVKVRANCIDDLFSNWTTPIQFKTPCITVTDGYSNSFEGADYFDLCWNTIATGAVVSKDSEDLPWFNEPLPKTGTKKIVMRTHSASSTQKAFLITPYVTDLDADKRIKFSLLAYDTYDGYNTNSLTIGTMSDPADASTFIALKTISPTEMNEIDNPYKSNLWKEHTVYLDNYQKSNNHQYIAIKQNSEGTGTFCIDDFSYDTAPACLEPLNPKTIDFEYDSATVTWENYKPASEWQIEYGPKGFAHGSGTIVNATASPFKITESVSDDTEYDFYVRAKCGSDYSNWSDKGYFRTKCLGLTAGYNEDFETAEFEKQGCWTRVTPYVYQRYWTKDRFIKVNIQKAGGTGAKSGLRSMILSNTLDAPFPAGTGQKADRVVLVSPRLKDFDHYKKINFWMVSPKETYNQDVELIIGTLSDPEDYSTFTPYTTIKIPVENLATWLNYEVDFSNYYGTDKFIGFKHAVKNYNLRRFVIDDFSYLENDCPKPSNLGARQSGTNSVTLDWKDNNSKKQSDSWDIEYGPKGFTEGTGTIINVKTNPYTLEGIDSNTFEYRVRTYCEVNMPSQWSDPYTFKTTCTKTAPFAEDFDQYPTNVMVIPYFCWTTNIYQYSRVYEHNLINVTSAPNVFSLQSDDKTKGILISPYLADFDSNKKVKFWLNVGGIDLFAKNSTLIIGTIKNPSDISTFEPYQSISLDELREYPKYGKEINVDFANYTGDNKQIAFIYESDPKVSIGGTHFVLIDNIHYDQTLPCYEPLDIVFSNVNNNSATIKWTSNNSSPQNVQIEYGLSGFTRGSGTILNTDKNEIAVTGLQTGSAYEFYFKTTCDAGNSIEAGPKKIDTTCDLYALPWSENFNSLSAYGKNALPDCFKLLSGSFIMQDKPLEPTSNYNYDTVKGYDDNTFMQFKDEFSTEIFSPMFHLNAGTTYKFSLKGRKAYEYVTQSVAITAGMGQNDYNMQYRLSGSGTLSEYNYTELTYYITPVTTGDYSLFMDFYNYGGARMIADNFEFKEGYASSLKGDGSTLKYDFQTPLTGEIVFEGSTYNSSSVAEDPEDANNKVVRMQGNAYNDEWKITSNTDKKTNSSSASELIWEKNQNSITKINMKVDAKNATALFMRFDLKQTFVASANESMFRVVVNGNVLGDVIQPSSNNGDAYQNYVFDLTPYVGSDIRISLQHLGKSQTGDNAFLDNLTFNNEATLAVTENNYTAFKFYPNPVENILNIESNSIISNIKVYNINGQLLSSTKHLDSKVNLDFKKYPAGVYLINMTSEERVETFKIIKK